MRTFHRPALIAVLALTGCGGPIITRVDSSLEAPTFHFSGGPGEQPPCISHIGVGAADTRWELESHLGHCVGVGQLDYGEPPAGLTEESPARPLSAGVPYSISIVGFGVDAPGGICNFTWRGGHWTTQGPHCAER